MIIPNKELGQHFLMDESVLKKISDALILKSCDKVLEIGPGPGYLTRYLLPHVNELHAVEIDLRAQAFLQPMQTKNPQLHLYFCDFLRMNLTPLKGINKACGNLPYQIAMPIIEKVTYDLFPEQVVFMLAEGTALRLMASPGKSEYSAASVFAQSFYHVSMVFKVSRHAFHPPPKIDSMVCHFKKKDVDLSTMKAFTSFVRLLFSYRRKTLANSLKISGINRDFHLLDRRVETFSITELFEIYQQIYEP